MKITVEVHSKEILKEIGAKAVAEHFTNHGGVDDLLHHIGLSLIVQHLRETYPTSVILSEIAEHGAIDEHMREIQLWNLKQKKEVG